MLAIRYLRSGRKNQSFFRIVLTEKSNPPKSNFIKVFGWYNPKTKETSLKKEEILEWVGKGAKPSNSVAKLLIANGITHKHIVFIPDAPKQKKSKGSEAEETPKTQPETETGEVETSKTESEVEPKAEKVIVESEDKISSTAEQQPAENKNESKSEAKDTKENNSNDQNQE